jgi:dihydrofolate reductase
MRSLAAVEFVTLDGVMQGFGSPDEDREGGFEHGGWGAPYFDHVQAEAATERLHATTAYLFGRRTYERMAAHWPNVSDENPLAAHLNATPKYVATRTVAELTWNNARRLEGDLLEATRALKAAGEGSIVVLGSGVLVRQLIAAGLVDGYHLFVHPLILGTGKRLFGDLARPQHLKLQSCTPTSTGVLMLSYAGV